MPPHDADPPSPANPPASIPGAASGPPSYTPRPPRWVFWMRISVAFALAVGAGIRLWFLHAFPEVNGDPEVYGDLAKNLLLHGQYAITDDAGQLHASLIRLPGYPLFMALCFRLFGLENYFAISIVQIVIELLGCLLLADLVRKIVPAGYTAFARNGAALCALWLSVLCPFTALYAATPLTEALTLFCITLALWSAARFELYPSRKAWSSALLFTAAVSYGALLRPDGALLAVALAPALLSRSIRDQLGLPRLLRLAALCILIALAPFALWAARNWQVFHDFQPLAPRYASDPGDSSDLGFERWAKTWALDFVSTVQIYWPVPGGSVDVSQLPSRACDTLAQCQETAAIFAEYNANGNHMTPELDARFAQLAAQRVASDPLRFYLWLPLGRVADMWLRPRIENLPIDLDWWVWAHHHAETRFSWAYASLNLVYVLLGFAGLCLRPRLWPWMVLYLILRSALLSTVEGPEARYTLEFFPILFATGGIALNRIPLKRIAGWKLWRASGRLRLPVRPTRLSE